MALDTTYTGREIIEMIKNAPDVDYVGEYLTGRILGDESFDKKEHKRNQK